MEPLELGSPAYEHRRAEITKLIPRWYSPVLHFVIPAVLVLSVLVFSIASLHAVKAVELLTIPAMLVVAFIFEWRVHKHVLHRRRAGASTLYVRHELQHHVIYTYEHMELRSYRELWTILMPSYAAFLVFLTDVPIAAFLAHFVSWNVGMLSLATAMSFFISYEWLHASYHLPKSTFIGRNPVIARLREVHRRHHDPRLMKHWNFNVTVPLFDAIFGTLWSPEKEAKRAAEAKAHPQIDRAQAQAVRH